MSDPANMIPLDTMTGEARFHTGKSSLFLFWLPKAKDNQQLKEMGIDTAKDLSTAVRRTDSLRKMHPARLGASFSEGGCWVSNRYVVEEGTCLKVYCSSLSFGVPNATASCILLCSKDAPLNTLRARLPANISGTKSHLDMVGRFWVLDTETALNFPEVPPLTPNAQKWSQAMFMAEVFEVIEHAPATVKPIAEKVHHKMVESDENIKVGGTTANGSIKMSLKKTRRSIG